MVAALALGAAPMANPGPQIAEAFFEQPSHGVPISRCRRVTGQPECRAHRSGPAQSSDAYAHHPIFTP